jgi:hypothetical protein
MSEEAQATQGSTSADVSTETQAQAPSAGEPVLKPAAAIKSEQTAITEAQRAQITAEATQTQATEQAPVADAEKPEAKEQDLGLLSDTKPVEQEGAPEAYEAFTFPEGIAVEESDVAALQGIAKEMNLPQASAQAGAEMTARALNQMIEAAQAESEAWKAEQKQAWEAQPNHAEQTLLASKAVEKAGLTEYMSEAGYMHDAKLLGFFAEFGKLISEASAIVGSDGAPGGGSNNPYNNSPEFK